MKKIIAFACIVFTLTSAFSGSQSNPGLCQYRWSADGGGQNAGKEIWSKNVWSTIDPGQLINSPVFKPVNENVTGLINGEDEMDLSLFESEKSSINWNLWTILKYHLLKGNLTFYSPRNPEWYATADNGYLQYPTTSENYGSSSGGTYFSDFKYAQFIRDAEYFGLYDYSSSLDALPSIEFPGEDSLASNGDVMYYPKEFLWYNDDNIIRYRLRERWLINNKGEVLDKIPESIAPLVNQIDFNTGEIIGQKELFWVDFDELKPLLAGYFVLLDRYRTERVISYADYFEGREYYASVEKTEEVQIKKEE